MFIRILFLMLFSPLVAQAQTWSNETEMLRTLQPVTADLTPVEQPTLELLGRGVRSASGDASLALACMHFDYPKDAHQPLDEAMKKDACNSFRVIYFKNQRAYVLSIPITADSFTPDYLVQAARRLFQEFLPNLSTKAPFQLFKAAFNQNRWGWGSDPETISELDFLRAVHGIHRMLEPSVIRRTIRYAILPSANWRLWADERYLDQITLFL